MTENEKIRIKLKAAKIFYALVPFLLAVTFPLATVSGGISFFLSYLLMNSIAFLPALSFWQCVLLAVPYGVVKLLTIVKKNHNFRSFPYRRKLLEYVFRAS